MPRIFRPLNALLWLSLSCLTCTSVSAGPWARGEGEIFVSTGLEHVWLPGPGGEDLHFTHATIYGEYGLGDRLTLVLDAHEGEETQTRLVLGRYTLTHSDVPHQFALSVGVGVESRPDDTEDLVVLGAHIGRGGSSRLGNIWTAIDMQYRWREFANDTWKLDATLGVTPSERWLYYGQFQGDGSNTEETIRLQTSAVRTLNARFKLEVGAIAGLQNTDELGVTLGLWSEF